MRPAMVVLKCDTCGDEPHGKPLPTVGDECGRDLSEEFPELTFCEGRFVMMAVECGCGGELRKCEAPEPCPFLHCGECGQMYRADGSDPVVRSEQVRETATLSRGMEATPSKGFRPVAVIEDPEPLQVPEGSGLAVTTAGGLRIEGLSWPQVLEMARVFS